MKALFIILLGLSILPFQNCSKKSFSSSASLGIEGGSVIEPPIIEPPIIGPPIIEPPIIEPPIIEPPGEICPRYELVVRSTHKSAAYLNYVFKFNGEMKHNSTQGLSHIMFIQDSLVKNLTQCSGEYVNTSLGIHLKPLEVMQNLLGEISIYSGADCTENKSRATYYSVVDVATGAIVFNDKIHKDKYGCGYGYTADGDVLNQQILSLADSIAALKAQACNK